MCQYGEVTGRADRRQFWGFALIVLLWWLGFSLVGSALGVTLELPFRPEPPQAPVRLEILGTLAALLHVVPFWSISSRRLHDVGLSAWWLILGIFPLIGPLILAGFFLWPGDRRENGYGSVPE